MLLTYKEKSIKTITTSYKTTFTACIFFFFLIFHNTIKHVFQGAGESQHFNGCPPGTVLHSTLPLLPQYDMVPAEALKLEAPWDHSRLPMPDLQDKQHVSSQLSFPRKCYFHYLRSYLFCIFFFFFRNFNFI